MQTNNEIQYGKPDIVVQARTNKISFISDVAIPSDTNVPLKEVERPE